MMVRSPKHFLSRLGLAKYISRFETAKTDLDSLFELSSSELNELGVETDEPVSLLTNLGTRDAGQNVVEHRLLSLIFVDLVGSTEMSVRMDVEEYRKIVSDYQTVCETVITSQGGHLGRKFGDGILAYFGFPRSSESDVVRCAKAAISILQKVSAIERPSDNAKLAVRIGIATGMTLVDESTQQMGAENGQVFGHTPNLAARLQQIAEPNEAIVCDRTRNLIGNAFNLSDEGLHDVKGISEQVKAWKLIDKSNPLSRFHSRLLSPQKRLVGRASEQAKINESWEAAKDGDAQFLTINGAAGIGKSMLVWDSVERFTDDTTRALHFQCDFDNRTKPFHPISVALNRQIQGIALEFSISFDQAKDVWISLYTSSFENALEVLNNILQHTSDYASRQKISLLERQQIFKFLFSYLDELQKTKTQLIVIEDLHWIDPTTQEFLEELIKDAQTWRLLIVMTEREEVSLKLPSDCNASRIVLEPLDKNSSMELLDQELQDKRVSEHARRKILKSAEGIPLYVEEFARAAVDREFLEADPEQRPETTAADPATYRQLPISLMAPLLSRLDIREGSRELVSVAAAIGRRFSTHTLARLLDRPNHYVTDVLDEMVRANILTKTGLNVSTYEFSHAVMQEASYEILLKEHRIPIHRRIAEIMLRNGTANEHAQSSDIARHLSAGEVWPKAKEYWVKAAVELQEISAHREAIVCLERALTANGKCDSETERLDDEISIREKIFVSLEASDWWSGEIANNLRAIQTLREKKGEASEMLTILNGVAGDHLLAGRLQKAREHGEQMLSLTGAPSDVAQVLGNRVMGLCEFFTGNFERSIEHFDLTKALAASTNERLLKEYYFADVGLIMSVFSAWARALIDDTEAAPLDIETALIDGHSETDDISKLYALCIIGCIHQHLGDPRAVLRVSVAARDEAKALDQTYWVGWASVLIGWANAKLGETESGLSDIDLGISLYRSTRTTQFLQYALVLRCDVLISGARTEEAAKTLSDLQKSSGTHEMRYIDPMIAGLSDRLERELSR